MPQIIIASGPVIIENNKVLLNKDAKDDFWKFCGGRVEEADGDFKATAIREAKEEMGLEIEIINQEPCFYYTEKIINKDKASIILVHFLAKRLNEISPGKDTIDWRWMSAEELSKENLAPNIMPVLEYFGF